MVMIILHLLPEKVPTFEPHWHGRLSKVISALEYPEKPSFELAFLPGFMPKAKLMLS